MIIAAISRQRFSLVRSISLSDQALRSSVRAAEDCPDAGAFLRTNRCHHPRNAVDEFIGLLQQLPKCQPIGYRGRSIGPVVSAQTLYTVEYFESWSR
jgi:hypothetical protein